MISFQITLSCIWVPIPVDWVILHWYACGADGRSLARSVYGHVITKFSGMGRLPHFLSYGAPPTRAPRARVELRYECPQRLSLSSANLFWGSFTNHNTGNYLHHGINITTNQRLSPTFRGNGNTINNGDSQTSPLPIFPEGGGTSVHRLWMNGVVKRAREKAEDAYNMV